MADEKKIKPGKERNQLRLKLEGLKMARDAIDVQIDEVRALVAKLSDQIAGEEDALPIVSNAPTTTNSLGTNNKKASTGTHSSSAKTK